jgi:hypothetical protein
VREADRRKQDGRRNQVRPPRGQVERDGPADRLSHDHGRRHTEPIEQGNDLVHQCA